MDEGLASTQLNLADMNEFSYCLDTCALVDHPTTGCHFTWNNRQGDGLRWAKLDRILVSQQWLTNLNSTTAFLTERISDHSPCLVTIAELLRECLKRIHTTSFTNLSERVATAKQKLKDCQDHLSNSPMDVSLIREEDKLLQDYLTVKRVELQALQQRAKIQYLQQNDLGTRFFYSSISARKVRNTIGCIMDQTGHLCTRTKEPVRVQEILEALRSIDRNKSPGIDGYTSGFFFDAWTVVGQDFRNNVLEFFQKGTLPKAANTTLPVLIPKMETPLTVKDFRPIACCNTYYKVVSKILANRLKQVLDTIVGPEQAAFVADRDIFDNSMLAYELVSKYGRAYLTPRCLLKVDIRKAFGSVNWDFLKESLLLLKFPPKFVHWIMACVNSPKYSLLINGGVEGFFPVSSLVFMITLLKLISTLVGVAADIRDLILEETGFSASEFPFKYLGLPLFNARITQDMFQSLLDKIKARIMHWANKSLSYAAGSPAQALQLLECCSSNMRHDTSFMYEYLRTRRPKVSWRSLVHGKGCHPKHSFAGMMVMHNALPTMDNMMRRGMPFVNRCALCENSIEDVHHLFFNCPFSRHLLNTIGTWLSLPMRSFSLVILAQDFASTRHTCRQHVGFMATIYYLWKERNDRIFKGAKSFVDTLSVKIKKAVHLRLYGSRLS
ncbi:uncharacterized protein LOC141629360 [Silene latifolia]|uniref:uncharacterized protein LOC141629360 n=1 Tax=Silene latifolia TaxID=37657 RepID=UPI003D77B9F9